MSDIAWIERMIRRHQAEVLRRDVLLLLDRLLDRLLERIGWR